MTDPDVVARVHSEQPSCRTPLYADDGEALKAVRDDFLYWTGKLTDNSLELSVAVIGVNWAVFGSVEKFVQNPWAKVSLGAVVLNLLVNLIGTLYMGELHRRRMDYGCEDGARWQTEYEANSRKQGPWPFTTLIENVGFALRITKVLLPLFGGAAFLIALFGARLQSG